MTTEKTPIELAIDAIEKKMRSLHPLYNKERIAGMQISILFLKNYLPLEKAVMENERQIGIHIALGKIGEFLKTLNK